MKPNIFSMIIDRHLYKECLFFSQHSRILFMQTLTHMWHDQAISSWGVWFYFQIEKKGVITETDSGFFFEIFIMFLYSVQLSFHMFLKLGLKFFRKSKTIVLLRNKYTYTYWSGHQCWQLHVY